MGLRTRRFWGIQNSLELDKAEQSLIPQHVAVQSIRHQRSAPSNQADGPRVIPKSLMRPVATSYTHPCTNLLLLVLVIRISGPCGLDHVRLGEVLNLELYININDSVEMSRGRCRCEVERREELCEWG